MKESVSPSQTSGSQQNKEEILRRRAVVAARKQSGLTEESTIDIVEFLLGKEVYAFELNVLREVVPLTAVTYIPAAPAFVLGVINLRGRIVAIIDLKAFLGVASDSISVFNKALILEKDDLIVGFIGDEVTGAKSVPLRLLQHSLPALTGLSADYFQALTDERVVILNGARILQNQRLNPNSRNIQG